MTMPNSFSTAIHVQYVTHDIFNLITALISETVPPDELHNSLAPDIALYIQDEHSILTSRSSWNHAITEAEFDKHPILDAIPFTLQEIRTNFDYDGRWSQYLLITATGEEPK